MQDFFILFPSKFLSAGDLTDLVKLPNLGLGPLLEKEILNPRKGSNSIFFKWCSKVGVESVFLYTYNLLRI